jgi:hypothetical protein
MWIGDIGILSRMLILVLDKTGKISNSDILYLPRTSQAFLKSMRFLPELELESVVIEQEDVYKIGFEDFAMNSYTFLNNGQQMYHNWECDILGRFNADARILLW